MVRTQTNGGVLPRADRWPDADQKRWAPPAGGHTFPTCPSKEPPRDFSPLQVRFLPLEREEIFLCVLLFLAHKYYITVVKDVIHKTINFSQEWMLLKIWLSSPSSTEAYQRHPEVETTSSLMLQAYPQASAPASWPWPSGLSLLRPLLLLCRKIENER